ncbi:hypothetical protein COBT_001981 [Conglomerata obtusa]
MDMIQLLHKNNVKNTTVLSRSGPYTSAYTNSEIRKIFNLPNLKICMNQNQEKINMTKLLERRKKILEIKNCGSQSLNFLYNSSLKKIIKNNNKYEATISSNDNVTTKVFDCIISAIGFEKNESVNIQNVNKPVYFVGWCKNPIGNLNDIKQDAVNVAHKISNYFKSKHKSVIK